MPAGKDSSYFRQRDLSPVSGGPLRKAPTLLVSLLLAAMVLLTVNGCARKPTAEKPGPPTVVNPAPNPGSAGPAPAPVPTPRQQEAVSPFTGKKVSAELVKRRPLAVMIDNAPAARPQAGLNKADLVYEVLVEGGITRFMAVFLESDSDFLGPVRSARHYFLDLALGLDAVYVHVGGSPQAYEEIPLLKVDNLDNMKVGPPFWRVSSRQAPHNLYTSTLKLRQEMVGRKMEKETVPSPAFTFGDKKSMGDRKVSTVAIYYPGGYQGYYIDYHYEPGGDDFLRYIKTEPHRNETSGEQLRTRNIVIVFAETRPIPQDDAGRIDVNLVGAGKALVFSAGTMREAKWEKSPRRAPLKLIGGDGKSVPLAVGRTWIEVVPPDTKVEVK